MRGNEPDDDPRSRQTERGENQRRRDAAWNSYKDQLANAWRNPPHVAWAERSIVGGGPRSMVIERTGKTDPGRAGEIERQGERWRHGR